MLALYVVSILIFVRSIVRVVEYIQGFGGYIMTHEAFLYIFDAVVMWLAVVMMNWIHPSEVAKEIRMAKSVGRSTGRDGEQEGKDGMRMDNVPV